jgi:hypothetical protein
LADLRFPPPKASTRGGGTLAERGYRFESEHPYGSPPYAWLMRFRQRSTGLRMPYWESLNSKGERVPGLLGRREADLPLYREADLRPALGAVDESILLVESESSVDALIKAGFYATTWAGGAKSVPVAQVRRVLGGHRRTVLIPDNDEAGWSVLTKLTAPGRGSTDAGWPLVLSRRTCRPITMRGISWRTWAPPDCAGRSTRGHGYEELDQQRTA